jgi:2-dehydro-3-deoxyphosphooctonate aldolase (KDO 8-P synthase)
MMVRTAIAAGADGIFIETHPDPRRALSDGANMLPLDKMKKLLEKAKNIHKAL